MDMQKYLALTSLVREARIADRATFEKMEAAKLEWKRANETLTERQKVLDGFIAQEVAEATGRDAKAQVQP